MGPVLPGTAGVGCHQPVLCPRKSSRGRFSASDGAHSHHDLTCPVIMTRRPTFACVTLVGRWYDTPELNRLQADYL
jgi:hypothetical protein